MESYVYVRRGWRRRGVGTALSDEMFCTAIEERRSDFIWSTYDSIPAGEPFSTGLGGTIGRVNRTSELPLSRLDLEQLETWSAAARRRAPGYELQSWDGPYPNELLDDAANFHHLMNSQPQDAMTVGEIAIDAGHVAELDKALMEAGRRRWTMFVRDPNGAAVGGTEIVFEPWAPTVAHQRNTVIEPQHRGLGLAKWAKAQTLMRLLREQPNVSIVRTSNAFSNAAMLAINEALGFETVEVRTEWRLALSGAQGSGQR
jgi:GNAT superfamily N-acetyltransferase